MFGILKKNSTSSYFVYNFFSSELLVYHAFSAHLSHTVTFVPQESVCFAAFNWGFPPILGSLIIFFHLENYILENGNLYFQDFVDKSETRFLVSEVGLSG